MTQYGGPIQSKTDDGATAIAVNQAFLHQMQLKYMVLVPILLMVLLVRLV